MTDKALKSVITCDMEGRIETFNDGAAALFGYPAEEIIGKKRVSLFSPGLVVLEHVENWLSSAVENGAHETDTVFIRKDGSRFAATCACMSAAAAAAGCCWLLRAPAQRLRLGANRKT